VSFADFWPRYLAAHADPRTRTIHTAGTLAASALVLAAIATHKPALAGIALIAGYGPAWASHYFIEHNRPETFRAPFSSLAADYLMAWHVLRGTIDDEIAASLARNT
jgi:hypothetical protein